MTHKQEHLTTPRASVMMQLLGSHLYKGISMTPDEFRAIQKLYGFKPEPPVEKPAPPVAPQKEDFKGEHANWDYQDALRRHEQALKAHENWQSPQEFLQAGADRNAMKHAEADGLRIIAWLAKFVPVGEDPLKTVVQLASDAGYDVDSEDLSWAQEEA